MKKFLKKLWVILLIQTLLIVLVPIRVRAAVTVTCTRSDNNRGVVVHVGSDVEVVKVRMYLKNNEGEWQEFYENNERGYTSRDFYFPDSRLRTNDKNNIKVKVFTINDGVEEQVVTPGVDTEDDNDDDDDDTDDSDDDNGDETETDEPDDSDNPEDDEQSDSKVETPIPDQGIAINEKIVLDMPSKVSEKLTVKLPEGEKSAELIWKTSNGNIANVDLSGNLFATGPGSCIITVTRKDNNKSATCEVIVKFRGKKIQNGKKVYFLDTQQSEEEGATKTSHKQNDAIILESDGKYALIDTGPTKMKKRVVQYLEDLQIKELEWVLITHFDGDHYNGYEAVSNAVKIKAVYMKNIPGEDGHTKVKNAATNTKNKSAGKTEIKYVTETKNNTLTLGSTNIKLYNTDTRPDNINNILKSLGKPITLTEKARNRQNMYSIVAVAEMNNRRVVFMGDLSSESLDYYTKEETKALQTICDKIAKNIGDVDVYKVAHHGVNGNRRTELQYYKPEYAVVTSQVVAKSESAQDNIVEVLRATADDRIYYTGKGTRVLSINNKHNIYFKTLDNDDSSSSSKDGVIFNSKNATVYAYTKNDKHTANLSNAIKSGKTSGMTWTSSAPEVASVDKDGIVTGLTPGTAIISVENKNKESGKCTVNVIGLIEKSTDRSDMENNTNYLQELIDNASKAAGTGTNAKQQTVSIPKGIYNFVATGNSPYAVKCKSNVLIQGEDKDKTILKPYGNYINSESGTSMFYYEGYVDKKVDYLYNADFKNFTINSESTKGKGYVGGGKGFMINMCQDCDWDNVYVTKTDGSGFGIIGPVNCRVTNCEASYCGKAATVKQGGASGFAIGTGYANNESIDITDCKAELNKRFGFSFEHQSKYYNENNQLFNSYDMGSFKVTNCTASENYYDFGGSRAHDVTFKSCKSTLINNKDQDKSVAAIFFNDYSVRCKFIDCSVQKMFTDVKSDYWAYKEIKWGLDKGVTDGISKWSFAPDQDVDRGMAIEMIWRAEGRPGEIVQNRDWNELRTFENGKEVKLESGFADLVLEKDTKYYFLAAKWAKTKGIIKGTGNGKFASTDPCKRSQFILMLWRLAGSPTGYSDVTKYTDATKDKVSAEVYDAIKWADAEGIIVGTENKKLEPERVCKRAEAMTMLYRMYEGK